MQAKAMQSPATPTSAKLALWICFWFAVVTCAVSYINHMISMAVDQFWLQRSPLTILTFPLRGLTMFSYVLIMRFGVGPKAVANSGGCWDNLGIRAARRIVPCGLRPSLSGLVSGFEQKIFLLAFKPNAKH